jgi:hypothetical protein
LSVSTARAVADHERRRARPPRLALVGALTAAFLVIPIVSTAPARAEAPGSASRRSSGEAVDPRWAQAARSLLDDVGFGTALPGGYIFTDIERQGDESIYTLRRAADLPAGPPLGRMTLAPVARAREGDRTTRSFAIRLLPLAPDPQIARCLEAAARSVAAHDDGRFYDTSPPSLVSRASFALRRMGPVARYALFALFGALALAATFAASKGRLGVGVQFKLTHLLPSLIQTGLLCYWSLYYPGVRAHAPLIVVQIAFAFLFDAALGFLLRRRWEASFAPVPIVLSINLFVQFPAEQIHLSIAIVAIALLSKAFLRRDGRHLMNPSAFALTLAGVLSFVYAPLESGDVSRQENLPANMPEVVLLLALVVQLRLPLVLISIAALTAISTGRIFGFMGYSPFWPPTMIIVALVATDPATSPRTPVGRVLYGLFVGVGLSIAGGLLRATGHHDFYGKIMPVPIANLLVPWFDRAGAAAPALFEKIFGARRNALHVAGWVLFVIVGLTRGSKAVEFNPWLHAWYGTPLIVHDPDGQIRCESNPLFCRPFTFVDEARRWIAGGPRN